MLSDIKSNVYTAHADKIDSPPSVESLEMLRSRIQVFAVTFSTFNLNTTPMNLTFSSSAFLSVVGVLDI